MWALVLPEFQLKKLGIILLSFAVSACATTDNKSDYQELTKGTSDKEKYEAMVSKIGQDVDLDKYATFEHFSTLTSIIAGSKTNNPSCKEILSQIENTKKDNEKSRPKVFDVVAGFQFITLPKGISNKQKTQLISKLSNSLDKVGDVCAENSDYNLVDSLRVALQR
tara:strand:- start:38 stop:535 length:498 start_codon:yes stop_codon:yes gene_type:complete